ncbi:MAG: tol-pal system YbgF family protein [Phycisphaeraceae bacterium JB051]
MRYLVAMVLCLAVSGTLQAQQQSQTPQQRIAELEARVASLEKLIKPLLIEHEIKLRKVTKRNLAQQRMRKDLQTYTQEQIKALEALYQEANKNLSGEGSKAKLIQVVQDYGKSNRAGCALLYLGQISTGDEQIQYFQQAIDSHADCYYGNGVQVGAYARLLLAARFAGDKQYQKAGQLLKELMELYPRSLDHKGQPLELSIDQVRKQIVEAQKQ